jgi:N-ethylmaleimide reductase
VWGKGRVGVRLSPNSTYNSMFDSDPEATFGYVAARLNRYGLAYLHVIEPRVKGIETISEGQSPAASALLRKIYKGNLLAAGGFDPESAEAIIERRDADMVAFGRYFISNPDLPRRIQLGLPLNSYNRDTFYNNDSRGYTDYPFYDD